MASDDDDLPQKLDLRSLQVHEHMQGESGSNSFWSATWTGQDIALKVLNDKSKLARPGAVTNGSSTPADEDLNLQLFLREAKICMQLSHSHIVRCFGVAQLPGGFVPNQTAPALAMAMERCEAQTIKDVITRGMAAGRRVYKAVEAFRWLIQISSALSYLHGQKPPIIHRDIRADSVLLKRGGAAAGVGGGGGGDMTCKLSEFGLHAVLYDDRSNALRRRAFTQTITNPLADRSARGGCSGAGRGGGGGDEDASQRAGAGSGGPASPSANGGVSPSSGPGRPSGGSRRNASKCGGHQGADAPDSSAPPAAGLGNVESLLKQLGRPELSPLTPQDMERIYGSPEKAESFLYMAPEVFNNLPYNERSDAFSFGMLSYELLAGEVLSISIFNTGRAAKMGVREPQGYAAKVSEGYRPPRVNAISESAWSLIERCWHPDPVQRPTMAAVEEQLRRLLAEQMEGGGGGSPLAASPRGGKAAPEGPAGKAVPRPPVDGPSPGCTQQCVIS